MTRNRTSATGSVTADPRAAGQQITAGNKHHDEVTTVKSNEEAVVQAWPAGAAPQVRRRKVLLSLRIDRDTLDWFREQGPGYQTRMNAVLRAYMEHARAI